MQLLIRGPDNAAVRGALRAGASSSTLNDYGFIVIMSEGPPFGSRGGVCYIKFVDGNGKCGRSDVKDPSCQSVISKRCLTTKFICSGQRNFPNAPQSIHLQPPSVGL